MGSHYGRMLWPWLAAAVWLAMAACGGSTSSASDAWEEGDDGARAEIAGSDSFEAEESTGGDDGGATAPYEGYVSEQYGAAASWLCHPTVADGPCRIGLDATIVHADGTIEAEAYAAATDAPVDCFYVYPTVSMDAAGNSDLLPGEEEFFTVWSQFARFGSVCRLYAPVYRQVTLPALLGSEDGDSELAYADVLDAWKHYIANENQGRGIVLVGHSQGSHKLRRLIAEEIEGVPALESRLISAVLAGTTITVPEDADVGGTFASVPLCRSPSQTGCVITFSSFRSTEPPPEDARFGRVDEPGYAAGCNNPAALAGGTAELRSYFPTELPAAIELVVGGPTQAFADPDSAPAIETPFIAMPHFLEGECVRLGNVTYLEVTVLADPSDPRVDDISGDLWPDWGLHLVDISLVLGDLLAVVASQVEAYLAR